MSYTTETIVKQLNLEKLNKFRDTVELGEECGLSFTGDIDAKNNLPIFIGNNRSWDYFNSGGRY